MEIFNGIQISDIQHLSSAGKKEEFCKLAGSVILLKEEDYDCSSLNIWGYRKKRMSGRVSRSVLGICVKVVLGR